MDGLTVDEQTERQICEAMREHGIPREEAMLLVALRHGYVYGAGDLVSMGPMSPQQRQLLGLDHDPEQLIAESRARLAGLSAKPTGADEDRPDSVATSTAAHRTAREKARHPRTSTSRHS